MCNGDLWHDTRGFPYPTLPYLILPCPTLPYLTYLHSLDFCGFAAVMYPAVIYILLTCVDIHIWRRASTACTQHSSEAYSDHGFMKSVSVIC